MHKVAEAADSEQSKRRGRVPVLPLVVGLAASMCASAVVSLAFGSEPLRVSGVWDVLMARLSGGEGSDPVYDTIVWDLRAPRVLMAAIVGAGLALAGAAMQPLVRTPLGAPSGLGLAAGAGAGT